MENKKSENEQLWMEWILNKSCFVYFSKITFSDTIGSFKAHNYVNIAEHWCEELKIIFNLWPTEAEAALMARTNLRPQIMAVRSGSQELQKINIQKYKIQWLAEDLINHHHHHRQPPKGQSTETCCLFAAPLHPTRLVSSRFCFILLIVFAATAQSSSALGFGIRRHECSLNRNRSSWASKVVKPSTATKCQWKLPQVSCGSRAVSVAFNQEGANEVGIFRNEFGLHYLGNIELFRNEKVG